MTGRIGAVALPIQVTMKVLEAHPDASPYEVTNIAFHWTFDRMKVLEEALKEVFEAWAGSEGFIPETAPEGYLLYLTKRMAHIARAALGETK